MSSFWQLLPPPQKKKLFVAQKSRKMVDITPFCVNFALVVDWRSTWYNTVFHSMYCIECYLL